ncbi:hypothetical protein XENOCAPTIV_030487 [Xenoophorus captivus]|uniref:Uncharacterized protein n=1 Tax=Xenoophorus captivus TaxID=1517983 RepID=A0ABV0SC98_9TELE
MKLIGAFTTPCLANNHKSFSQTVLISTTSRRASCSACSSRSEIRKMNYPYGTVRRVDTLTARTSGSEGVNSQILRVDMDIKLQREYEVMNTA